MEVASLVARFSVEGERAIPNAAQAADRSLDKVGDSAGRNSTRVDGFFSSIGGFLLGGALIGGVGMLGKSLLSASADAETMRNSLNIAVGDTERAGQIFESVQKLAASTPFAFPELMQATTNLEAFGLSSVDWLTTIGDTAAGTGKSVDQVTQAVLDAQTGSYERLKELGIATRVEGDRLTFSYMENGKKIEQTVDRTNQELVNSTLEGIWNSKYEGAMAVQSQTFAGQWSTLKDTVLLSLQSMTAGVFGFATDALGFLNSVFANGWRATFEATFGSGVVGMIDTLGNAFHAVWDPISAFAGALRDAWDHGARVSEIAAGLPGWLQPIATPLLTIADSLGDLWSAYTNGGTQGFFDALGTEARTIAESGIDLGKILVKGTYELGGMLVQKLWDWVAEKITGKTGVSHQEMIQGKGSTGDMGYELTVGEVLVTGSYKLSGGLVDFDLWFTEAIGLGGSQEGVEIARQRGEDRGKLLAEKFFGGFRDGWGLFGGGDDIEADINEQTKPPPVRTKLDEWFAYGQSIPVGLAKGVWDTADHIADTIEAWGERTSRQFQNWVTGLPGRFATWFTSADTWLMLPGANLIAGLMKGWEDKSLELAAWATNFGVWVSGLMEDAPTALMQRGAHLIAGLMGGWTLQSNTLSNWAKAFGGWVFGLMPDSPTALTDRGVQLIGGLMDGWETKSLELATWATNLPGWIAGQIPDFSQALWDNGWNLMNNLWQGLENRWNDIVNWLKGLDPRDHLPDWSIPLPSLPDVDLPIVGNIGRSVGPGKSAAYRPSVAMAARAGGGRSTTNYISLDGAILGKGAADEIMGLIEGNVIRLVDGRTRSLRMGEAR